MINSNAIQAEDHLSGKTYGGEPSSSHILWLKWWIPWDYGMPGAYFLFGRRGERGRESWRSTSLTVIFHAVT